MENRVELKRVHDNTVMPQLGTPHSAAFDLYSVDDIAIAARSIAQVDTGLVVVHMTPNIYAQILSRSGLALAQSVFTVAGVIDPDYRGRIIVLLYNGSNKRVTIRQGYRVAQMVFLPIIRPLSCTLNTHSLKDQRGATGFGSTDSPVRTEEKHTTEQQPPREIPTAREEHSVEVTLTIS